MGMQTLVTRAGRYARIQTPWTEGSILKYMYQERGSKGRLRRTVAIEPPCRAGNHGAMMRTRFGSSRSKSRRLNV
jgi:hypothetical protein